jgi:predicted nucleic acid-binding protein
VKRFVLDTSVTLAWLIDRTIPPYAARIKQLLLSGDRAIVPSLWRLEIANGFLVAERRGLLTPSDTMQILQAFEAGVARAIEESPQALPMRGVMTTARQFQLTAYDAEYLDTARIQQLPLATLDRQLEKAALQSGLQVL